MPDSNSQSMDYAASDAMMEIVDIKENNLEGLIAVEDWMKKWILKAGYKRLRKILADRWN